MRKKHRKKKDQLESDSEEDFHTPCLVSTQFEAPEVNFIFNWNMKTKLHQAYSRLIFCSAVQNVIGLEIAS